MKRALDDHGTAQDAIDYALDHEPDGDAATFLRRWRMGDLGEWPEFYEWLDKRETEDRAWLRAEKKRLKGFRIGPAPSGSDGIVEKETGNE